MDRNGYKVDPQQPVGRQSAGASFLEAYLQYSGNTSHRLAVSRSEEAEWFHAQAKMLDAQAGKTHAWPLDRWGDAAALNGIFHFPDPCLDSWSWKRMPWGDSSYSLLGIVHTICSYNVQHTLGQFSTSPVRHWDALICTSKASKVAIEGFLERQETWLRLHNEAMRFERPQLPVIPLGIRPEAWAPPGGKREAGRQARTQLGIDLNADVVLIAGRLDLLTKFQPAPLFQALESLRQSKHPNLEVLVYGEAPEPSMHDLWVRAVQQLAPQLKVHWVPGKDASLAGPVRWAADVFVSLSDNPQETFGITPLEAMAAELPCLVSDWDGYKESVIQPGEAGQATGFRVTTRLVEGLGAAEAHGMLHETLDFCRAVGRVSQGVAIDLEQFQHHLSTLLSQPELREAMGTAGRARVQCLYNWKAVIEQWRQLAGDLNDRRRHAIENGQTTPPQLPPWMPDTSVSFGNFASEILPASWNPTAPSAQLEAQYHNNPFQKWDDTLLKQTDARRKGWWLKQGLVQP